MLAFLSCVVLRLLSTIALTRYVRTGKTNEELSKLKGFHVSVVAFLFGTVLGYVSLASMCAYLVKTYIL